MRNMMDSFCRRIRWMLFQTIQESVGISIGKGITLYIGVKGTGTIETVKVCRENSGGS